MVHTALPLAVLVAVASLAWFHPLAVKAKARRCAARCVARRPRRLPRR